jgi:hypothetical protein
MNEFPAFMKNPANRIAKANQATPGVEGYVFDGEDGSQIDVLDLPPNGFLYAPCSRL